MKAPNTLGVTAVVLAALALFSSTAPASSTIDAQTNWALPSEGAWIAFHNHGTGAKLWQLGQVTSLNGRTVVYKATGKSSYQGEEIRLKWDYIWRFKEFDSREALLKWHKGV